MLPKTHPQHRGTVFKTPNLVHKQAFIAGRNKEAQLTESYFQMVQKLAFRCYATSGDFLKNPGILLSLAMFLLAI
jgi:hypothetical protein